MSKTIRNRIRLVFLGDADYYLVETKKQKILYNTDKYSSCWGIKHPQQLKAEANKILRTHQKTMLANCLKKDDYEYVDMTYHVPKRYKGLILDYI